MKRAVLAVGIVGLVGLALGVVAGLDVAASSTCDVFSDNPNATCYRYLGRYFSDTMYYAVNTGLWGLGIGLVCGLLAVTAVWLSRRGLPANRDITG